MKIFFLLLIAAVVAAQLSRDCQYVSTGYYLSDLGKIERCFDSYTVSENVTEAIVANLEVIKDIYPYVDIASNPPRDPPGYFKVMNYTHGLEMLKNNLSESGRVISKVARSVKAFVNGFRDAHFSLGIARGSSSPNIFANVQGAFPFTCTMSVSDNGQRRVYISVNEYTEDFLPGKSSMISSKFESNVYVVSVDGKDAFSFFSEFFGEYNPMKSQQGRLMQSFILQAAFYLLDFPVEHAFDEFTLSFSDGSELTFSLGFINLDNEPSSLRSKMMKKEPKSFINYVSHQREMEVLDMLEHIDVTKRPAKREHVSEDIACGMFGNMNYLSLPTFDPEDAKGFFFTLLDCLDDFDNNDKPITIILEQTEEV